MTEHDEKVTEEDVTEAEVEVEGFGSINTTRSNIKNSGAVSIASGMGGVGTSPAAAAPSIAIKENGIK